ncbi:MAG: hypothetical protein EBZ36_05955 [Acidobacteria bacterium]|nr:hypothetical protein [Acidobacteriota bacterium]
MQVDADSTCRVQTQPAVRDQPAGASIGGVETTLPIYGHIVFAPFINRTSRPFRGLLFSLNSRPFRGLLFSLNLVFTPVNLHNLRIEVFGYAPINHLLQ